MDHHRKRRSKSERDRQKQADVSSKVLLYLPENVIENARTSWMTSSTLCLLTSTRLHL